MTSMRLSNLEIRNVYQLAKEVLPHIAEDAEKLFESNTSECFANDYPSFEFDEDYDGEPISTDSVLWNITAGASKIVAICDDYNFVVKFPVPTQTAIYCGERIDYCEMEFRKYESLLNSGFRKMFCEVRKLITPSGIVYIQKKVSRETRSPKYDVNCPILHQDMGDQRFWSLCYQTYGEVVALGLMKFCKKHHINDLHAGNFKITKNGLEIFDYSGYVGD